MSGIDELLSTVKYSKDTGNEDVLQNALSFLFDKKIKEK